ncbi:transglutaminase domain-containing protein [Faecalispora anaeroviscerum]|uniref:transglutaminase domain-containing protein n=1 Tax=Faecalispora anaeroviscerum TaxID=2991836 RepID=UPI0024BA43EE|nr:hypothetical protein [Faecalispora anaeroviscerum]
MKKSHRFLSFVLIFTIMIGTFMPSTSVYAASLSKSQQAEQVAEQLVKKHISADMSVEEKYYALALLEQCTYDKTFAADSYTAYGSLVNHKAVCSGMALAYQLLCKKAGLYCDYITSRKMDHGWNIVKVGNHYYHMDMQSIFYGTFLLSDEQRFRSYQGGRTLMDGYQSIPVCDDGSKFSAPKNEKYNAIITSGLSFQGKSGTVSWLIRPVKSTLPNYFDSLSNYEISLTDSTGKIKKEFTIMDCDSYQKNYNLQNYGYNDTKFTFIFDVYDGHDVIQTAYSFDWNGNLISKKNCDDHDMEGFNYQGVMYSIRYDESSNTSTLVATDADLNSRDLSVFTESKMYANQCYPSGKNGSLFLLKNTGISIKGNQVSDLVKVDVVTGTTTTLLKNICSIWMLKGYIREKDVFGTGYCYFYPEKTTFEDYMANVYKSIYVI